MDTPIILDGRELGTLEKTRARAVSAPVARQMLHLLGDNEHWTERPSADELEVWSALRSAKVDEHLFDELATQYPEQAEAMRHGWKHWGLQWLRDIVEADRQLDVVAELGSQRAAVRS